MKRSAFLVALAVTTCLLVPRARPASAAMDADVSWRTCIFDSRPVVAGECEEGRDQLLASHALRHGCNPGDRAPGSGGAQKPRLPVAGAVSLLLVLGLYLWRRSHVEALGWEPPERSG